MSENPSHREKEDGELFIRIQNSDDGVKTNLMT